MDSVKKSIAVLVANDVDLLKSKPGKDLEKFCPKGHLFSHYIPKPVVRHYSLQGPRKEMEDAYLIGAKPGLGAFYGVFDGHGDQAKMASWVRDNVISAFKIALKEKHIKKIDQIGSVFRRTFRYLHQGLEKHLRKNAGGTTALVGFIPEGSSILYTATVGDSEAKLYRNGKVIPLSRVETWKDPKPLARARFAMNDPEWIKETKKDAKHIHYPGNYIGGVNVPHTLGDFAERSFGYDVEGGPITIKDVTKQAISFKPTSVTAVRLKAKDTVIFACDGLWDYGLEKNIQKIVQKGGNNLAKQLAETSVKIWQKDKGSGDNVTVLSLHFSEKKLSPHTF